MGEVGCKSGFCDLSSSYGCLRNESLPYSESMLKADDRDIPILMPDEKVLVTKPLKSTIEAELETTRKELNEYKNRAPKLEFGFDNGQNSTKTIVCPSSEYNAKHAESLAQALDEK